MWKLLLAITVLINVIPIILVWKSYQPIPDFRRAYNTLPVPAPEFAPISNFGELNETLPIPTQECNLLRGKWVQDLRRQPLYGASCPFINKNWNCFQNKRPNATQLNSWRWAPSGPENCSLPQIQPYWFLRRMRNKMIGFVGDTVNENFMVSLCCILYSVEKGAAYGNWPFFRRVFFYKFNLTVDYLRDDSVATYEYDEYDKNASRTQTSSVRMDIGLQPWLGANTLYDVIVFNSQHWWNRTKGPTDTPLIYNPPQGLSFTSKTASNIRNGVRNGTFNIWLTPFPVHYHRGSEYDPGGCPFSDPLTKSELESWWFRDSNYLFARNVSSLLEKKLASMNTDIKLLDLSHLSEFRIDAHPASWQGKRDLWDFYYNPKAWEECRFWCLPGLPDTWVDVLSALIAKQFTQQAVVK